MVEERAGNPTRFDRVDAVERVKEWTRQRYRLEEDAIVMVTESVPKLPGYPPLQTAVSFWIEKQRHHFTLYKPVTDVDEGDIPPAWMKDTLALSEGVACSCC